MEHSARKEADLVWKRDEIDSPCVSICVMHPLERICTGCHRTIDEITRWSVMSARKSGRKSARICRIAHSF